MATIPDVHLLIICHGLWGERKHVKYLCDSAEANVKGDSKTKLVVLPASLNENTLTYDGIDLCGERVVKEIDSEVERIKKEGLGEVKKFSIVGYSLGGLVARYAIGVLHSREPSFFESVKPVNFATFASPAIGIPRYDTFWSGLIFWLGARMLSRSGNQLYGVDSFLPSTLEIGLNSKKSNSFFAGKPKEIAEPLLAVMADPRYNFYKALTAFQRIDIFANAVNDRTVPYPTGAIEEHDPFELAKSKALKGMKERGEDTEGTIDYREGGLNVILDPIHAPLILSYATCSPPPPPSPSLPTEPKSKKKWRMPLLLRPTTYPFSRPVSLLIIVFLPITLPLSLLYLIGTFTLQGRDSRRRIKEIRLGLDNGKGREGMLERVGLKSMRVAMEEMTEDIIERATVSEVEEDTSLLKHPALVGFATYGGTDTPPLAKAVSNSEHGKTDPVLSEAQKIMIANLNGIKKLRKHLTFLPNARNSHGIIVVRDEKIWDAHKEGRPVVDFWAGEFVL